MYKGKQYHTTYSRVVGLELMPCLELWGGRRVTPDEAFWVDPEWEGFWEVDHVDDNVKNNAVNNLEPLWWENHAAKKRPTRSVRR